MGINHLTDVFAWTQGRRSDIKSVHVRQHSLYHENNETFLIFSDYKTVSHTVL